MVMRELTSITYTQGLAIKADNNNFMWESIQTFLINMIRSEYYKLEYKENCRHELEQLDTQMRQQEFDEANEEFGAFIIEHHTDFVTILNCVRKSQILHF